MKRGVVAWAIVLLPCAVIAHARVLGPRDAGSTTTAPPFVLVRVGELLRARAADPAWKLPWDPPGTRPAPPRATPPARKPPPRPRDRKGAAFAELDEATGELGTGGGGGAGNDALNAEFQTWKENDEREFAAWKKEHAEFLQRADTYKPGLLQLDAVQVPPAVNAAAPTTRKPAGMIRVVPGALEHPVRDQGRRGTCAAFAALRAMEIMLRQNGRNEDLSEQYLYWLSRPECQVSPCGLDRAGSWIGGGVQASQAAGRVDIPGEQQCPYSPEQQPTNETQTPLPAACLEHGRARVADVQWVSTTDEILAALDAHRPVVVGTRLSENFFRTEGLVTLADARRESPSAGLHARGHAYVIVGYMEMPPAMHAAEGRLCFLAANSWGTWGVRGHACLTENWFREYRHDSRFLALGGAEVPD